MQMTTLNISEKKSCYKFSYLFFPFLLGNKNLRWNWKMKDGRKRESPEVFVDQPITPIMNLIVSVLTMAEAFKEETEGRR